MIQKRFYIDMEHFSPQDGAIHGDMGFTICDMPDTMTETLERSIESVRQGIEIDRENGYVDEKEGVYIYSVIEYTFDTDLFEEGDEDYSMNSPAIIDTKPVYAMCHPCSDEVFAQVQEAWKERNPNPDLELVRFEDDDDEEEPVSEEPVKEAYIVAIECRTRVVVEFPKGTSQEEINRLAIEKAIKKISLDCSGYLDADNCTEVEPDKECPAGEFPGD